MDPINKHPHTQNNRSAIQENEAPGARPQPSSAEKTDLSNAQSLNSALGDGKSIQGRILELKKEEIFGFSYELLASLPPEMVANIISHLDQKDVWNFIDSICDDLMEALHTERLASEKRLQAVREAKKIGDEKALKNLFEEHKRSFQISNRHWSIQLLDVCLNNVSWPIDFDHNMRFVLHLAKCCDLPQVLDRSPSLCIDFKRYDLSYEEVIKLFNEIPIGVKQLELRGISENEICFSTKYFPNLKTLKVHASDALKSFAVEDEGASLEQLNIRHCPLLETIDIQACNRLTDLNCLGLGSLTQIKLLEKNQLKNLILLDCDMDRLDWYTLGNCLSQSCVKLNLGIDPYQNLLKIQTFILQLQNLKEIELSGAYISLKTLPSLEKITFEDSDSLLTQDLGEYACLKSLKELNLKDCEVNDLHFLVNCPNLEILNLGYVPALSRDSLNILARLTKLRKLELSSGIKSLDFLARLTQLEDLNLYRCEGLNQESFEILAGLTKLKKLNLESTQIESLDCLIGLKNLEALNLYFCKQLSQESFEILAGLPNLKKLNIGATQIENLGFLRELSDLEDLDVSFCKQLSQEALDTLAQLRKLKRLHLRDVFKSSMGQSSEMLPVNLGFFQELVNLEELDLTDCCKLDPENFGFLVHLKKLKKLILHQALSLKNIEFLAQLRNLEELDLMWCRNLKAKDLEVLAHLTELQRLNLNGIPVEDMSFIKNLKHLERINLDGTTAFNRSSPELAWFPSGCSIDGLKDPLTDPKIKASEEYRQFVLSQQILMRNYLNELAEIANPAGEELSDEE